jgi:ABC-2 type transport system ATP-binding protein
LAIIDHGQIVAEGTPEELKRQIAGDVVRVGLADGHDAALELLTSQPFVREAAVEDGGVRLSVERGEADMPAVLRLLDSAGLQLQTISLSRPSLDDVFLRKTGRSLREQAA